ncbi:hypothetical protein AHAS_Ahas14G0184700 [Arachis hypogaea]
MTCSLPDPSLAAFDPEIERTISRIRRVRCWLASEGGEVVTTNSPVLSESESKAAFEEETSSSSIDSVDLHADNMAKPRRITLQEAGAPDFTLQLYLARHLNLAAKFELKAELINLISKFHNLPTQEPIKHLQNFQTAYSTATCYYEMPFLEKEIDKHPFGTGTCMMRPTVADILFSTLITHI